MGNNIRDTKTHTILQCGKQKGKREFAVAFKVDKAAKRNIMAFTPINDRMCKLRIKTKFFNLSIINVHAPTVDREEMEKEEFYSLLERTYDSTRRYLETLLVRKAYNNGLRATDVAMCSNITSSTYFPHKNIHKRTCRSPDGKTFNQIHHVPIDKSATSIMDVRTYRGASRDSDHYLVKIIYRCRILAWTNDRRLKTPKIKVQKLEDPAVQEKYHKAIEEKSSEITLGNDDKDNVDKTCKTIKGIVMNAAVEILRYDERNYWFDNECETVIRSKNQAYETWLGRPTRAKRIEYEKKRRLTEKLCRKKKRHKLNEHLCRITEEFNKNDLHKAFKEVRSYREGFKLSTEL
jgi:hypothetical protein